MHFIKLVIFIAVATTASPATAAKQESPEENTQTQNSDERSTAALHMQILLDRLVFSPGAIDGLAGKNAAMALRAFQRANQLKPTGQMDESTSAALKKAAAVDSFVKQYRITSADATAAFIKSVPAEMADKAKLDALAYTDVQELIAERFHTTPEMLVYLNPSARWEEGESVVVPNVRPTWIKPGKKEIDKDKDDGESDEDRYGKLDKNAMEQAEPGDLVTSSGLLKRQLPEEDVTVVVTRSESALNVLDNDGNIIFHAPVTTGSKHDPLPVGSWKINGTEMYPRYSYNPDLFWDAEASDEKAKVPPGPNNPVGVAWIDISKPHYGLHGTPDPSKIGYTESHGCVRLTNWDVLRLADIVKPETDVEFLEVPKWEENENAEKGKDENEESE